MGSHGLFFRQVRLLFQPWPRVRALGRGRIQDANLKQALSAATEILRLRVRVLPPLLRLALMGSMCFDRELPQT